MKVTISYAHDDVGRALAKALVNGLRERGFDVTWDGDLPTDNPVALPEWISNHIATDVVLCLLSPDYVRRFGNGTSSADRKGVLFESRILLSRIYEHTMPDGCPIIPVADHEFSADLAPAVLKNLVISRLNTVTGDGLDIIARRLLALQIQTGETPDSVKALPINTKYSLLHELEAAEPSSDASQTLVRTWLATAKQGGASPDELTRAFPAIERIIKAAGDAELMVDVVDHCLGMAPQGELSAPQKVCKATVLIRGRAWHLQRQHELAMAIQAIKQGIELINRHSDRQLIAHGKRLLGDLYCDLAKDALHDKQEEYLTQAMANANAASIIFGATNKHDSEYGVCLKLQARIYFTRYRLRNQHTLHQAKRLANQALNYLNHDETREYHELLIMRAEISIARNKLPKAKEQVDQAIRSLTQHQHDGASYTELLGWAYLASAKLRLREGGRHSTTNAAREAESALQIFHNLSLPYAIATANWELARLAPETVGVEHYDIRTAEKFFADPRELLLAIDARRYQIDEKTCSRWGRRATWKDIVDKIRNRR